MTYSPLTVLRSSGNSIATYDGTWHSNPTHRNTMAHKVYAMTFVQAFDLVNEHTKYVRCIFRSLCTRQASVISRAESITADDISRPANPVHPGPMW